MGLFSRRADEPAEAESTPSPARYPVADESLIDESGMGTLRPRDRRLNTAEEARVQEGLRVLADQGVNVDDLESLGAGFDRELTGWRDVSKRKRPDHDGIVEAYGIGIGEHLTRATDLRWRVVTDVFGTDLAVADQREGDFVVVPHNLVAARWMRAETGWIPAVVRHLIAVRAE